MTKPTSDTNMFIAAIQSDPVVRSGFVSSVADAFIMRMRREFDEGDLIAIDHMNSYMYDPGVCATHDYSDANVFMTAAIFNVVRSSLRGAQLSDDEMTALIPPLNEAWNSAWEAARYRGFSRLWEHRATVDDEAAFKTLALVLLVHPHPYSMPAEPYPYMSIEVKDEEIFDRVSRCARDAISSNHEALSSLAKNVKSEYDAGDAEGVIAALEGFAGAASVHTHR